MITIKARRLDQDVTKPLGDRLRFVTGRGGYGLKQVGGDVYLVAPKPVIRIGPRGGSITGYHPDGTPEYGGVFMQKVTRPGVTTPLGVTKEDLQTALDQLKRAHPNVSFPKLDYDNVVMISETGELQRFDFERKQYVQLTPAMVQNFVHGHIGWRQNERTGEREPNWRRFAFELPGEKWGNESVFMVLEPLTEQVGEETLTTNTLRLTYKAESEVTATQRELGRLAKDNLGWRGIREALKWMYELEDLPVEALRPGADLIIRRWRPLYRPRAVWKEVTRRGLEFAMSFRKDSEFDSLPLRTKAKRFAGLPIFHLAPFGSPMLHQFAFYRGGRAYLLDSKNGWKVVEVPRDRLAPEHELVVAEFMKQKLGPRGPAMVLQEILGMDRAPRLDPKAEFEVIANLREPVPSGTPVARWKDSGGNWVYGYRTTEQPVAEVYRSHKPARSPFVVTIRH